MLFEFIEGLWLVFVEISERHRVICPACGEELPRDEAREYDKYGDRWERDGKDFEYFCKPCHREMNHSPRADVERVASRVRRRTESPEEFATAYVDQEREVGEA